MPELRAGYSERVSIGSRLVVPRAAGSRSPFFLLRPVPFSRFVFLPPIMTRINQSRSRLERRRRSLDGRGRDRASARSGQRNARTKRSGGLLLSRC